MTGAELQIPPRFVSQTATTMNIIIKQAILVWHNPYVTDGLIAMWDGEWNAPNVRHDPKATSWLNIATGEYATPIHSAALPNDVGWGPNYAYFDGVTGLSAAPADMPSIADANNSGECELDGIFRVEYDGPKNGVPICGTGWTFHLMENFYHTLYNYGGNQSCIQHNGTVISLSAHPLTVPIYLWMTKGRIHAADFQKGSFSSKNKQDAWTIKPSSGFGLGYSAVGTSTTLKGRIFNIRIYNRALTDKERAANYEIDRIRFKLTDAAN